MPVKFTKGLMDSCKGIPPQGCKYCDRGAKMVLYITGICKQECFYCPLSEKKKGRDVVYANERLVDGTDWMDQVVDEAKRMRALGTGITGGDPLVVPERTAKIIRRLKKEFGPRHHVHLYTTGPFDTKHLISLKEAGLDEIRFHPPIHTWPSFRYVGEDGFIGDGSPAVPYSELILEAKKQIKKVGLEIPAVVDAEGSSKQDSEGLLELVRYAIRSRLDFVNINELEASHTNMVVFKEKGFDLVGDSMAVKGSKELAWSVIYELMKERPNSRTVLHFCSSVYKDSVQLRHRLKRMADNLKQPYEIVTDDGTYLRGIIETQEPGKLASRLQDEFEVPMDLMEPVGNKLLIAPWVLEEIGSDLQETLPLIL